MCENQVMWANETSHFNDIFVLGYLLMASEQNHLVEMFCTLFEDSTECLSNFQTRPSSGLNRLFSSV